MPQAVKERKRVETKIQHRIINRVKGSTKGPKLIFFAGIHGNEPAGVIALQNTLERLDAKTIKGEIIGIYGNLAALEANERFIDEDLNRIWTKERLQQLKTDRYFSSEHEEQKNIYLLLEDLISTEEQPIYFVDFHTTSSATLPFITINDALINRNFSLHFPVPIVLGIEEYLDGPLLSFLNEHGFVSLGFEAGQHNDPNAITNCEAFIYLSIVIAGLAPMEQFNKFPVYYKTLRNQARGIREVFEVLYKYDIKPSEDFKMNPGFASFQKISKGVELASSDEQIIRAPISARLFMPLYQKKGRDGFFIIKAIPRYILKLSTVLRSIKADTLLTILPGISWHNKEKGILKADLKVTRFMAKSIFHLLGYRNKQMGSTSLLLYNRERVARNHLYDSAHWFTNKKKG